MQKPSEAIAALLEQFEGVPAEQAERALRALRFDPTRDDLIEMGRRLQEKARAVLDDGGLLADEPEGKQVIEFGFRMLLVQMQIAPGEQPSEGAVAVLRPYREWEVRLVASGQLPDPMSFGPPADVARWDASRRAEELERSETRLDLGPALIALHARGR